MGGNPYEVAEPYGGVWSSPPCVILLNQQTFHTTHEVAGLGSVAHLHW